MGILYTQSGCRTFSCTILTPTSCGVSRAAHERARVTANAMSERPESDRGGERLAGSSLLALAPDELQRRVVAMGGRAFHARILRENVLAKGVLDYESMTSLPSELRARLAAELPVLGGKEIARSSARDGTTKLLVEFARAGAGDAHRPSASARAAVEVVHMPSLYASADPADRGRCSLADVSPSNCS